MTDRPRDREPGQVLPFDDETEVGRRLTGAGARPEIPEEDLEAISAASRAAWRRSLEKPPSSATAPWGPVPDEPAAPHGRATLGRQLFGIALVAALAATLGLGVFWATMTWMSQGAGAARVEAVRGEGWIEAADTESDGAGRRPLAAGAVVGWEEAVVLAAGPESDGADLDLGHGLRLRLAGGGRLALVSGPGSEAPFEAFFRSLAELASGRPHPLRARLTRGALYADTGSHGGDAHRLEITTPRGTVWDVGTRFSLRLQPGGEPALEAQVLEVRVRSGEVVVAQGGRQLSTRAGEELVISAGGGVERRPVPRFGEIWRWAVDAPPGFDLEGATVDHFLAWVGDETGWRIAYADATTEAAAADITLHGELGGLAPDRAPFAVLPSAGLAANLEDGELRVRRQRP